MIHALKIKSSYFNDVITCKKTFEVRQDDRGFQEGDLLALNEIDSHGEYTGKCVLVYVTYILSGSEYMKENYVGMSIKPCVVLKVPDLTEIPDCGEGPEVPLENFYSFVDDYNKSMERKENDERDRKSIAGFGN